MSIRHGTFCPIMRGATTALGETIDSGFSGSCVDCRPFVPGATSLNMAFEFRPTTVLAYMTNAAATLSVLLWILP